VTAGFWANGALNTLSSNITGLPSQTYSANGKGRPSSVTAGTGQNPVTSTSYDLVNYKTTVNYGSLDSDVFTLDPNTGRLAKYQFNVGSNSDIGALTWNANSSLKTLAIADTVPSTTDTQTCNYTHDDLARAASANCGSAWNETFGYDAFGNVTKNATVGISFTPGYSPTTNQFTSLPGVTPTYDTDGRLTYDGTHNYAWDAESEMHSVDTTTLTYDAFGRMVEKAVSTAYTQIVYSPLGSKVAVMSGQTLQQGFVPLPTGSTAVYTSTGLAYYRHTDHLGSSRLATTPTRTLYSSTAYAPFGEAYKQVGTTDLSFTGQNQDTVSGIHDFMDRRYTPVQGRWLTPDPIGLAAVNPASPQTWNRYAYVMNNPLALVDPFGDDCYDENGSPMGCGGNPDGTVIVTVGVTASPDPSPAPTQGPTCSDNCDGGPVNSGGGPANNATQIGMCLAKGAVVGAASALAVGALAVAAVAVGAPVAAVTGVLGVLAVAGGAALGYDVIGQIRASNWAGLAYDVGSLAGSAAVGGAGGRAIAKGINGVPSPPWSPASDWAQTGYKPSLGSPWKWLGTGPNPGSAGGAAATTGAGTAQILKSGC
jgi:RHS repeat-associated protein